MRLQVTWYRDDIMFSQAYTWRAGLTHLVLYFPSDFDDGDAWQRNSWR